MKIFVLLAIAAVAVMVVFMLSDKPESEISVDGVGTFKRHTFENSNETLYYTLCGNFKGKPVDYNIYPKEDGSHYNAQDKARIRARHSAFSSQWDSAIRHVPAKARSLCENYSIKTDHLSDNDICESIVVNLVKLDPNGGYELYCTPGKLDDNFDLVIQLDESLAVTDVHFDG